jgi:23S rRNA (guanosine2251-2'-O)-methyltransferase
MKAMIWGRQPVLEILRSPKTVKRVILRQGVRGEGILKIRLEAAERSLPIEELPPRVFDKLVGKLPSQGVIAELESSAEPFGSLEDVLQKAQAENNPPFILVVDGVEDPQNLGAMIRSAEGAGVHSVVIRERRSAPLSGTVMKTSAGAAAHLPIIRVPGLPPTILELKAKGIWVVAAIQDGEESLFEADLTGPIAIVVGGENQGISPLVLKRCDRTVRIPMKGQVGSLNVAASAAIILFEILRQRTIISSRGVQLNAPTSQWKDAKKS